MKNVLSKAALAALAAAGGIAATTGQADAQVSTVWTGTVGEVRDEASGGRFKLRGRLQYDVQSNDWDVLDEDGTRSYVRRAFLGFQGRFNENWRYKVDFILTPSSETIGVDDAYLEYARDNWSVLLGEHNITSPLEDRISSLDIPFIERTSVINAFEYGRRAGLGFLTGGANWSAAAALQGDSLNNSDNSGFDESTAVSGRFTWAPVFETTPEGVTLVHLGAHARMRDSGGDAPFRYRTRPLNGRGTRWIDAGGGLPGGEDFGYGAEAALQFGPFGAQAEYIILDGESTGGAEYEFDGYYVDVYWSLTGESRAYRGNQGSFGAIAPARPVTEEGGIGHWMLSGRYDYVDLSDPAGGAARGEQSAYSLGLDWVPIDHVRFKLNYALSEMDRTVGTDDEAQIISLRSQFDF
jgi:phosphate-selective porin OprO/OprP